MWMMGCHDCKHEWVSTVPGPCPACGSDAHFGSTVARAETRLHAELAVANMRIRSMEQQRDSARRIARALYLYAMAECNWPYGHDSPLEAWARADRVLAEEARREEEAR